MSARRGLRWLSGSSDRPLGRICISKSALEPVEPIYELLGLAPVSNRRKRWDQGVTSPLSPEASADGEAEVEMAKRRKKRGTERSPSAGGRIGGFLALLGVCIVAIGLGYSAGMYAARWLGSAFSGGSVSRMESQVLNESPSSTQPSAPAAAPNTQSAAPSTRPPAAPQPPSQPAAPPSVAAPAPPAAVSYRVRLGPFAAAAAESARAALIDRGYAEAWRDCSQGTDRCFVQVGAFADRSNAENTVQALREMGYSAFIEDR